MNSSEAIWHHRHRRCRCSRKDLYITVDAQATRDGRIQLDGSPARKDLPNLERP